MINIKQLNGNTIKKLVGAQRVMKQYENKHVDGSGNFGYYIRMKDMDSYSVRGDYGTDGSIYNMSVGVTYLNGITSPQQEKNIELIKKALYTISIGGDSIPKRKFYETNMPIHELKKIERDNIAIRNGRIPDGQLDLIHYYILEDANFHTLNNELTKSGKFGKFKHKKYQYGDYWTPLAYGKPLIEARFKKYQKLGGRTWQL